MVETYVDMLKQELLDRKARSPLYSERAFARDLKLSSGFISLLFNGKRGLSPRTSLKVLKGLNWTEIKVQAFMRSVQSSQFLENKKIVPLRRDIDEYELKLDQFRLISNINHFVVLELIQTRKIKSLQEIIDYLRIEKIECEMVLKCLLRLEMVKKNGNGYKTSVANRKLLGTPSEAIRNYHRQSLEAALDSIETQEFHKRELRGLTLSLDPKKLGQSKKYIDKFVKNFNKKFGNKRDGEVYQMNVQLFSHCKKEGGI